MTALRKNDIVELSDLEFVLKRGHNYTGSMKENIHATYLYNNDKIEFVQIPFIPAVDKIISEIIDNAIDENHKTNGKYANKISVEYKDGTITVHDNGRGLPIEQNEKGKWIPEAIFTQLRTGSNFDDNNRASKGMNGLGAALCSMLSRRFSIDTCNGSKRYEQVFENHLQKINRPKITDSNKNYTEVTFTPNYDYFNMSDEAKSYLPRLIEKRLIEQAFCFPNINFKFNGKAIVSKSITKFLSSIHDVYEYNETDNCRIGLFYSDSEFKQISFVNGLTLTKGGTHIDYVTNKIVEYIREYILKKHKLDVKPNDIKQKLFLILSFHMKSPEFDGQTKERLESQVSEYKDIINEVLSEKFLKSITKNEEIIFPIVESYRLKQQVKENQELKKITSDKRVVIDKYLPASEKKKYLVLTEGDGALGLISSVLGRKDKSYFPLKGKPLNTLEASKTKISENVELRHIIKILNLRMDKDDQSQCNYDNILLCCDADADGQSIKSLMLCFFYRFAKSLIEQKRILFLETPLVVAKQKGKVKHCFMNFEEYNRFKTTTKDNYEYVYLKGLGSNKKDDLKEMFEKQGLDKFIKPFELDETSEQAIYDWMSKTTRDKRKEFLRGKEFDISAI